MNREDEPPPRDALSVLAARLADRLRVVGPRFAAREGPEAAAVLVDIRAVLQRLADLAADAEGRARRRLPVLAPHALGDQVLVLTHDLAVHAGPAQRRAAQEMIRDLAARL